MKKIQQGFTLIELMIVVAIVGILAAIALPAYQDYVIRSKMSEAEAAIAACKTSISEYFSTKNGLPANADQGGCSTTPTQYVASLAVDGTTGAITVVSANTGAKAAECTLIMTPTFETGSNASVTLWTGSSGSTCDAKYLPSGFR